MRRSSVGTGLEALEGRWHLSVSHGRHHHHHHKRATPAAVTAKAKSIGSVNATRLAGSEMEAQVAANPANANNLVIVSQSDVSAGSAIPVSRSFDGGRTWSTTFIDGSVDGYGTTPRPDARAIFDAHGNLYVVYMVAASPTEVRLSVVHSSNGGASFDGVRAAVSGKFDPDGPALATGPDATDPKRQAVWISFTDYRSGRIMAVGGTSAGLGQFGGWSAPRTVSDKFGAFSSVAVGPKGEVAVAWQDTDSGQGPTHVMMDVDAKGLGGAFGKDRQLLTTNVGGWDVIPAQANRSIDAEPKLAFDRSGGKANGRLYLAYTDENGNESNDTDVYLKHTDDLGASWSKADRVNDDSTRHSQFLPSVAVDQSTGDVGVSWYDARNSATNTEAQLFVATSADHGTTFAANVRVSAGLSNQARAGWSSNDLDYGDVGSLAFDRGRLMPVWSDNSNSGGDNAEGTSGRFDAYTAVIPVA